MIFGIYDEETSELLRIPSFLGDFHDELWSRNNLQVEISKNYVNYYNDFLFLAV